MTLRERFERIILREDRHSTHAEDEILKGPAGSARLLNFFKQTISLLEGNGNGTPTPSIKIDGAPALTMFSSFPGLQGPGVSTKSLFNKTPIIYNTVEQVENSNLPDTLKLKMKMGVLLAQAKIIPPGQIWQGDLLWTTGDAKKYENDGESYVYVKPNTLVYAAPEGSDLAASMLNCKIGIGFHTRYVGQSLQNLRQSNDIKIEEATNIPEWAYVIDARVANLQGKASFSKAESIELWKMYEELEDAISELEDDPNYEPACCNNTFIQFVLMTLQNHKVDKNEPIIPEQFVRELHAWITQRMRKEYLGLSNLKTKQGRLKKAGNIKNQSKELHDIAEANEDVFYQIAKCISLAVEIKQELINKMEEANRFITMVEKRDGTFNKTGGEGFVVSDVDGNFVKLVDRSAFSHFNRSPDVVKGFEHRSSKLKEEKNEENEENEIIEEFLKVDTEKNLPQIDYALDQINFVFGTLKIDGYETGTIGFQENDINRSKATLNILIDGEYATTEEILKIGNEINEKKPQNSKINISINPDLLKTPVTISYDSYKIILRKTDGGTKKVYIRDDNKWTSIEPKKKGKETSFSKTVITLLQESLIAYFLAKRMNNTFSQKEFDEALSEKDGFSFFINKLDNKNENSKDSKELRNSSSGKWKAFIDSWKKSITESTSEKATKELKDCFASNNQEFGHDYIGVRIGLLSDIKSNLEYFLLLPPSLGKPKDSVNKADIFLVDKSKLVFIEKALEQYSKIDNDKIETYVSLINNLLYNKAAIGISLKQTVDIEAHLSCSHSSMSEYMNKEKAAFIYLSNSQGMENRSSPSVTGFRVKLPPFIENTETNIGTAMSSLFIDGPLVKDLAVTKKPNSIMNCQFILYTREDQNILNNGLIGGIAVTLKATGTNFQLGGAVEYLRELENNNFNKRLIDNARLYELFENGKLSYSDSNRLKFGAEKLKKVLSHLTKLSDSEDVIEEFLRISRLYESNSGISNLQMFKAMKTVVYLQTFLECIENSYNDIAKTPYDKAAVFFSKAGGFKIMPSIDGAKDDLTDYIKFS
jgi:hypothetical protein